MQKIKKKMIVSILSLSLCWPSALFAASPSEGLRGTNGEILSQVNSLAGSSEFGDRDGAALSASFRNPASVAVASDGTIYIADTDNQLIRKLKNGTVESFAGNTLLEDERGLPIGALLDGAGEASSFSKPHGLDVDARGNVYVADADNHAIRKITPNGTVTTLAGNGVLGDEDGRGKAAAFYSPTDVAVTADGVVYVADTLNHAIRKITPDGTVTTLNAMAERLMEWAPGYVESAGSFADGPLAEAAFNEPSGLALDERGNLYVSDTGNQLIRYIDLQNGTVSTVAGLVRNPMYQGSEPYAPGGYVNGAALQAQFHSPRGIAVTAEGGLVIADSMNHAIRYLHNGQVITLAGALEEKYGDQNGINGLNRLHAPSGVAVQRDGSILIADSYNNKVRVWSLYTHPEQVEANGSIHVVLNGQVVTFDAQPEIANARTMVPVRAIGEALGYEVEFEGTSVKLSLDDKSVTLQLDDTQIAIEAAGEEPNRRFMDVAPYAKDGRTYVPLRFFSEEFGMDVQWDADTRTAILREKMFD
ncbi:copper amine oxidase [Xylanibacillus composti]|uniref:Copper amine oxidase n=1 Tax=Xylanibacillus composti TaxID=1572762 RepID=A0A8J4H3H2_9BACL|nr:stalk domain-containing protein [Xylanibacillus composti]MDT9724989.1 copper amine oxidase [Xylanibacillus composti]GIQ68229.1 copper amine oxidase [Xylanibacillus composti]